MSENFDEPWIMDEYYVLDKTGAYIGLIGEMGGKDCSRRIVACVNALEGVATDRLESANTAGSGFWGKCINDADVKYSELAIKNKELTSQRDELLAALKEVVYCSENFGKAYAGRDARDKAKALIKRIDHA